MDDIPTVIDDAGPDPWWLLGLAQEPHIGSGLSGGFWQCGPVE